MSDRRIYVDKSFPIIYEFTKNYFFKNFKQFFDRAKDLLQL